MWGMPAKLRRRGNPNWGKPVLPSSVLRHPTEFDMQVRRLALTRDMLVHSTELRRWCAQNRNRCYIPEWLLDAWNLAVEADLTGAA